MRPHGHECIRRNVCFDCQGRLRARKTDSFGEIMYDDGRVAFAAPVCSYCRMISIQMEGAPRVPQDFDERLKHLRSLTAGPNYAVALWSKTVQVDDELRERRYCVNMDGSVVTRFDTCDLQRRLNSFVTDGWKPFKTKKEYKSVRKLLRDVDSQLTAQGFRRLF